MKKSLWVILLVFCMTFGVANCVLGATDGSENVRLGVGLGIPYGVIGGNLELGLTDNIAVSGAIGITPADMGWSFGGRYYFAPRGTEFRPRIGVYYGTVGIFIDGYDYWNINGVAFGGGIEWKTDNMGLDADLMLPIIDGKPQVKISFGCGIYF